jgi:hypothetical protein
VIGGEAIVNIAPLLKVLDGKLKQFGSVQLILFVRSAYTLKSSGRWLLINENFCGVVINVFTITEKDYVKVASA